jgi:multidrug efflux pump
MMCSRFLELKPEREEGWLARSAERLFAALLDYYDRSLSWALRHARTIMLILLATLTLNFYLFAIVPKIFFPPQDTGRLIGGILADQSISFQAMRKKLGRFIAIIRRDPAVANVVGFTGGRQTNSGFVFVSLKPESERNVTASQIIARLRRKLALVPGAKLFLQSVGDIRAGGRAANAAYQYTLEDNSLAELYHWEPILLKAFRTLPALRDVNSTSEQDRGLEANIVIDRATAARLGLSMSQVDNTLYDAFGQRLVSTIFTPLNQYHVVMDVAPADLYLDRRRRGERHGRDQCRDRHHFGTESNHLARRAE